MNNKGVISIFLFIAIITIGLGVLSFFKTVQKQIPKVEVESSKGVSVLGIDIPLPKLKITPPSPQPSPTSSPKASSSPLTSPSQTSSPASSPTSSPGSSPTSSPRSSPSSSPSITPSPTPSPPSSSKKFSCDFNTFEKIPSLDGSDPNLVKAGDAWFLYYTKISGNTTNIHTAYLPNASLGAPANQWVKDSGEPLAAFNSGAWDNGVTETASFATDGVQSRIYYVAHDDPSESGRTNKPLKIGFLYNDAGTWKRHPNPVFSGEQWWEMTSPRSAGEFGEPSVVHYGNKWHMYYQTCSNQTATNGYPAITYGCFIGHRISSDGITWSAPIGFGNHPWMYASVTTPIGPIPVTGFTKPEVKLTPTGSVQWVGGNNRDNVRYGEAPDLNSAPTHEELLFTVNDCKTKGSWCNWRIDTGHTFGVAPDGSIWVFFTATECLSGARPYRDACPSVKWNISRVHCPKNP